MMKCCAASSRNLISTTCAMQVRNRAVGGLHGMKLFSALLIALILTPAGFAQAKPAQTKAADPDRLGLPCAQILQMSSTAWVVHFAEKAGSANNSSAPVAVRAI